MPEKMTFKKGDFVVIRSRRVGAEVTGPGSTPETVRVRIATISVQDIRSGKVETAVTEENVPVSDLVPLCGTKGVVVL